MDEATGTLHAILRVDAKTVLFLSIFLSLLIPHPLVAGGGRKRLIFIQRRANAPPAGSGSAHLCGEDLACLGERRELTKGDIHTASIGPGCRSTCELHTQRGGG
jgi:hypothetical protein